MFPNSVKNPISEAKEGSPPRGTTQSQRRRHVSESNVLSLESGPEKTKFLTLCSDDKSDKTYELCDKISLIVPAGALLPHLNDTLTCVLSTPEYCSLELDRDEEAILNVVDIMSEPGLGFQRDVVLKFTVEPPGTCWINCYKQEPGNSFWEHIEKQGDDTYMKFDGKNVFIYTKHFTKFVCTCKRFPQTLGFDIVVLGKHYRDCTPKSAHEVELKIYTFDTIKDSQELDDFVENTRKYKDRYIGAIFRDVMRSVKEIQVSDKIRFTLSLPEQNEDWKDPKGNTGQFQQSVPIQRLLECHSRRRTPRPDAAQFILHTQKGNSVRFAASLAVAIGKEQNTSAGVDVTGGEDISVVRYMRISIPLLKLSNQGVQATSSSPANQDDGHLVHTRKHEIKMNGHSTMSAKEPHVSSLITSSALGDDSPRFISNLFPQGKPHSTHPTGMKHEFQKCRSAENVPELTISSAADRQTGLVYRRNLERPRPVITQSESKALVPLKYFTGAIPKNVAAKRHQNPPTIISSDFPLR